MNFFHVLLLEYFFGRTNYIFCLFEHSYIHFYKSCGHKEAQPQFELICRSLRPHQLFIYLYRYTIQTEETDLKIRKFPRKLKTEFLPCLADQLFCSYYVSVWQLLELSFGLTFSHYSKGFMQLQNRWNLRRI